MSSSTGDLDGRVPRTGRLEQALTALAEPAPDDFALTILRRAGVPAERYDRYVLVDAALHPLYVAYNSSAAVTSAALDLATGNPEAFEEWHRARTGRSAVPTSQALPGLRTAVRTGRSRRLPVDLSWIGPAQRAVLDAVRLVPSRQLRPLSWIAREASLADVGAVLAALALNRVQLLIPCHRVTGDDGLPCDAAFGAEAGDLLRAAEGIDMSVVRAFARDQTLFLGSDTTRIFCHPTCSDARRITPMHRVPFPSARAALRVGYRPCGHCRPVAA